MQYFETIKEYGAKLLNSELGIMGRPRIYYRVGKTTYATRKGAFFPTLNDDDIADISSSADAVKAALVQSDYHAAIECKPQYVGICIEREQSIPSVLDDSAMIVGREAKLIDMSRKELCKSIKLASAVLIKGGSAIVFGRTLYEAYTCLEVLEKNAQIYVKGEVLGGANPVKFYYGALEHLVYELKYSSKENDKNLAREGLLESKNPFAHKDKIENIVVTASITKNNDEQEAEVANKEIQLAPMSDHELELRKTLVAYGNLLVKEGLVKGTWGNLSVKLDDEYMLCTPSGLAYDDLAPENMVKVHLETLEYEGELKPTSEKKFHAGIYLQHPTAGAVVHTHSTYSCIFASAGKSMSLKGSLITDSKLVKNLGLSIPCAKYGLAGTDKLTENVLSALSDSVGCFMKHHGMVCYAVDMPSAFERALLIEGTAEKQINKKWKKLR